MISTNKVHALSLIEVMAAMLIMGTLVASMLTSMAGSVRQIGSAEMQLTASHLARELLAEWTLEQEDLMVASGGTIDASPEWSWTRSAKRREVSPGIKITEITLLVSRSFDALHSAPWSREFKVWIDGTKSHTSG